MSKTLKFKTLMGEAEVKIHIQSKNPISILLVNYDEEYQFWEPWCDVTKRYPGYVPPKPNMALVKNYSENIGVDQFLIENKLGKPTGRMVGILPEFEFDIEKLQEYEQEKLM